MRTPIAAAELGAHPLCLRDDVGRDDETLVVTKRGEAVAEVDRIVDARAKHCGASPVTRGRSLPTAAREPALR